MATSQSQEHCARLDSLGNIRMPGLAQFALQCMLSSIPGESESFPTRLHPVSLQDSFCVTVSKCAKEMLVHDTRIGKMQFWCSLWFKISGSRSPGSFGEDAD